MREYYLTFKEEELEIDEVKRKKIAEELEGIEKRLDKTRQFIAESKLAIERHGKTE